MGLFDIFTKKKINTLFPTIPLGSQIAIERGIVTWQGGDQRSFVDDGYVANDIVYGTAKNVEALTQLANIAGNIVVATKGNVDETTGNI